MSRRILITGGAGFIGSHLADELLKHGYKVKTLDMLCSQVHGDGNRRPAYLSSDVEFVHADLRDPEALEKALKGMDAVFHLAAAVGVGQSMYQVEHYVSHNDLGTAVLLQALIKSPVEKLVVASSMSIYGEGLYRSTRSSAPCSAERSLQQLATGDWELRDDAGTPLEPIPTPENKAPALASIYALSKYTQERMCLLIGRAYKIPTIALRFFNIYGPRQSLSNPYTGVLAIFASRYLNDKPPLIFEDGNQKRDFVNIRDIVTACRLCLETPGLADQVFNVGSGRAYSVREVADCIARVLNRTGIDPEITGKYRMGDIRHCFADIGLARQILNYRPRVELEQGMTEFAEWLEGQTADDHLETASAELAARGLTL